MHEVNVMHRTDASSFAQFSSTLLDLQIIGTLRAIHHVIQLGEPYGLPSLVRRHADPWSGSTGLHGSLRAILRTGLRC